ncbi:hypothetical protein [Crateriforma conspicua]|nr:hypothetical protein [Crateriforma conspicua]
MNRSLGQNLRMVLSLRCDENRHLHNQRLLRRLTVTERLAMWGHWLACGPCRRLIRQLSRIDHAARRLGDDLQRNREGQSTLPSDSYDRIARAIHSASPRPTHGVDPPRESGQDRGRGDA